MRLEKRPGTYLIWYEAMAERVVVVGKLGVVEIRLGVYGYVGSAFGGGGLHARVGRHLRPEKKRHWHIDYVRPVLRPVAVWGTYDAKRRECEWGQIVDGWEEVYRPLAGFGASDCGCQTHFFTLAERPELARLTRSLPVDHAAVWQFILQDGAVS